MTPICPYCERPSKLVKGDIIYPRNPRLHSRSYYLCAPCKAWVGCHPNSIEPLGGLANAELRAARVDAHAAFDPHWQRGKRKRGEHIREARMRSYAWLALQLGIPLKECHIGMFDVETCRRVVKLCQR